jgi:hypothetical protein
LRVPRLFAVCLLAAILAFAFTACGGDDNGRSDDTAAATSEATETPQGSENEDGDETEEGEDGGLELEVEGDAKGPARSSEIDELLAMHPIFPTKRFMNFAARGNPDACSLLSAKGRKTMQKVHGTSCEETIRKAAASHDEPGLVIYGEFVPVDEFSDLEFMATIFVSKRERGTISIAGQEPPFELSRYGKIWLLDSVPLTEIGNVG